MSFGGFNDSQQPAPMAEINVTPMVDVMLVLLVIFILAAPLFTHAVKLELPQANAAPAPTLPTTITLSIDAAGAVYWNDVVVPVDDLPAKMALAARQTPVPDLQLRADRGTRYEVIARVMAAAQANGLNRIGFVTEPQANATEGAAPTVDSTAATATSATAAPAAGPASAPAPTSLQLKPSLQPPSGK